MFTPLGRYLRTLRVTNGERLMDMAKRLEVSTSFLSSIEYGRRLPPEGFGDKIIDTYNLDVSQASELSKLYAHEREKISMEPAENLGKEAAVAFARRVNHLSPQKLEEILKILKGIDEEGAPFPSGVGALNYLVSPRSWKQIDSIAVKFRQKYEVKSDAIDVMDILENKMFEIDGVCLDVLPEAEMGLTEGLTDFDGSRITLRQDVYEGAWTGNKRARFTVAHEIGHFVLHRGQITGMSRMPTKADKEYCLSEPQANRFASGLLMPKPLFKATYDVSAVSKIFGVSKTSARIRLQEYWKEIGTGGPEFLL